jgi:hypothetical protein
VLGVLNKEVGGLLGLFRFAKRDDMVKGVWSKWAQNVYRMCEQERWDVEIILFICKDAGVANAASEIR